MGSPVTEPGRGADETLHQVALTHMFQIQASEVTQGQFEQLMARNPANFTGCGSGCPVDKVSWHEAAAYTNALSNLAGLPSCYTCTGTGAAVTCSASASYLSPYDCSGYRLPTEAEWEYAVRAGTSAATYNGTPDSAHLACEQPNAVLDSIAWYCGNALATTHVGGQKSANAYGMYDMLGSLWEWVHDYYAAYPTTPVSDPWGPSSGGERVCRGGGWNYHGFYERAAQRGKNLPTYNQFDIGFRPARTL
jgi:formylglycine-generating enzyme required for sulfatase activity